MNETAEAITKMRTICTELQGAIHNNEHLIQAGVRLQLLKLVTALQVQLDNLPRHILEER